MLQSEQTSFLFLSGIRDRTRLGQGLNFPFQLVIWLVYGSQYLSAVDGTHHYSMKLNE